MQLISTSNIDIIFNGVGYFIKMGDTDRSYIYRVGVSGLSISGGSIKVSRLGESCYIRNVCIYDNNMPEGIYITGVGSGMLFENINCDSGIEPLNSSSLSRGYGIRVESKTSLNSLLFRNVNCKRYEHGMFFETGLSKSAHLSNVTVDGVICQANDNNFTLQGNIKGMRVNNFHFERNVGIRLKPNVPGRSPNIIVFDHGIFSNCYSV